ncbi:hypothetical protein PHET_01834 [Paragonimus heterotremus]|uniref:Uncharacterized protein n=1 Tax=Paragonimus heterotremus TaxID=100268 RepID=A0A8J4WCZ5_9TREM|nr:hypothetical protein PHET_01834 [Paragonimus heterotremus]
MYKKNSSDFVLARWCMFDTNEYIDGFVHALRFSKRNSTELNVNNMRFSLNDDSFVSFDNLTKCSIPSCVPKVNPRVMYNQKLKHLRHSLEDSHNEENMDNFIPPKFAYRSKSLGWLRKNEPLTSLSVCTEHPRRMCGPLRSRKAIPSVLLDDHITARCSLYEHNNPRPPPPTPIQADHRGGETKLSVNSEQKHMLN